MSRGNFFSGVGGITKVSFGVVTVFLYSFLLFNTSQFVSAEHLSFWTGVILSYTVMLALIIGVSDARSKLFNVSTIKFIPRYILFFLPAFFLFAQLFNRLDILNADGLVSVFLTLPKWLFFIHFFVFVVIESTVQVWAEEHSKLGRLGTALVLGAMHVYVWVGPALLNFALASLLFLFFSYINWRFRKDKNDLAPLCGVHSGYNVAQMIALS